MIFTSWSQKRITRLPLKTGNHYHHQKAMLFLFDGRQHWLHQKRQQHASLHSFFMWYHFLSLQRIDLSWDTDAVVREGVSCERAVKYIWKEQKTVNDLPLLFSIVSCDHRSWGNSRLNCLQSIWQPVSWGCTCYCWLRFLPTNSKSDSLTELRRLFFERQRWSLLLPSSSPPHLDPWDEDGSVSKKPSTSHFLHYLQITSFNDALMRSWEPTVCGDETRRRFAEHFVVAAPSSSSLVLLLLLHLLLLWTDFDLIILK